MIDVETDDYLKTVLTYPAMVAAGVEEAHPSLMRLSHFRTIMAIVPVTNWTALDHRVLRRLTSSASQARRTLEGNPAMVAYYAQRAMYRSAGRNPDDVPRPPRRDRISRLAEPHKHGETEEQRLRRLAARPLHDVAGHRYGERGPDVKRERSDLRAENWETLQAQRQVAKWDKALQRAADKLADPAKVETMAPEVVRSARAALAELQSRMPWGERVLHDLATITRLGRPLPAAARHPRGDVPLHLRPHHPATD